MAKGVVILGTAHLGTTPGKCSPDKKFREAVYSRDIVAELKTTLEFYGLTVYVDYEPLEPNAAMKSSSPKTEQSRELKWRVDKVNEIYKKHKTTDNVIYVSVHNDAAGSDGKWHNAGGMSIWTSRGKTKSDSLAEFIYEAARPNLKEYDDLMKKGKADGTYSTKQIPVRSDMTDGDHDYEADFYVLKNTNCPAVLVECFFQDNKYDVEFLLSDIGRFAITRIITEGILRYFNNLTK